MIRDASILCVQEAEGIVVPKPTSALVEFLRERRALRARPARPAAASAGYPDARSATGSAVNASAVGTSATANAGASGKAPSASGKQNTDWTKC